MLAQWSPSKAFTKISQSYLLIHPPYPYNFYIFGLKRLGYFSVLLIAQFIADAWIM